jgi:fructose-1-phosphate kinase PfkB-like protein
VPPDFYARLTRIVQEQGARALLDSSGESLRLGCAASPHLAKPNAAEAEEVTGQAIRSDADALRAAKFFLGQGLAWVALSLGADGLLLASARRAVRARPPHVQASHSTGAGDALLAGIAMAMERELPAEEMARWGVAAGAAAAAHEGVSVGTRAEVRRLYEQVQVERVNP